MSEQPILSHSAPALVGLDLHHPINAGVKIINHETAEVFVEPRRSKVAIIGFAESCRMLAPFNDPSYEIWGLNQLYRHIPRADRWFDIHTNWNEFVVEGTDFVAWLQSFQGPIYMTEHHDEIPNSVRFPLDKIIKEYNLDYFQSTPSYMIALAIMEGFTTIDIYGIDLIAGGEYQYQKPNMEYWIGVAHGKGIEVGIPIQSALLKQRYRYGYQLEPESLVKMSEINERMTYLQKMFKDKEMELANIAGAMQDTQLFLELATLRVNGSQAIRYTAPK